MERQPTSSQCLFHPNFSWSTIQTCPILFQPTLEWPKTSKRPRNPLTTPLCSVLPWLQCHNPWIMDWITNHSLLPSPAWELCFCRMKPPKKLWSLNAMLSWRCLVNPEHAPYVHTDLMNLIYLAAKNSLILDLSITINTLTLKVHKHTQLGV